jgi:hypothetical protein
VRLGDALLAGLVAGLAGCGGNVPAPALRGAPLPAGVRPVGAGPRFQPPLSDRPVRACRPGLGRRTGAHLELFAQDRVVIVAAGIGTRPPRHTLGGRITGARCYGDLVTIDPTGLILLRPPARSTVGDVFAAWGRPLRPNAMAGFRGAVRAWVGGRRWTGPVAAIPLRRHAEIVLEVGPYVPPHRRYRFPPAY